ncbi:MAG TPA: acyl-homoserine-lactone synthase [Terriglobia bacterium]|nr:acyl-homoserine-lactone synthase [Terriglobia bacterium]
MMQMIVPGRRHEFEAQLDEMYQLRYRVFRNRLGWNVDARDGKEIDGFDAIGPVYLLQQAHHGHVQGCVRMLPCSGPTMLTEVFPMLLGANPAPAGPRIWESSRFALDVRSHDVKAVGGLTIATYELFLGMVEFGISWSLTHIVTVTDLRIERILRRAGWPLCRIHEPMTIDGMMAVAGYLEISLDVLRGLREASGLAAPVLWQPALPLFHAGCGRAGSHPEEYEGEPGEGHSSERKMPGPS